MARSYHYYPKWRALFCSFSWRGVGAYIVLNSVPYQFNQIRYFRIDSVVKISGFLVFRFEFWE